MLDKLFEYQLEDVKKLAQVPHTGNFSDMGTGKTYSAIGLDEVRVTKQSRHQAPRTLVVAPLSVLSSWEEHYNNLVPEAVTRMINPKKRHLFLKDKKADVYMLHWDALRLMPELQEMEWTHVIADEVHRGKNRKAKQTKALKRIPSLFKSGLSGTPMINRPDELWSILNWLYPKQFTSYWKFYNRYCEFEMIYPGNFRKVTGPKNVDELRALLKDFTVRHLKVNSCCDGRHPEGVNPWLPEKYYTREWVELTPGQRRSYDQMRKEMIAWVGEQQDKPLIAPVAIAKLVRLQQFALASCNVSGSISGPDMHVTLEEPSSKLDALMDIITDNPNESIVVFSQFNQMIKLVEQRLNKHNIASVKVTGDVSQSARQVGINRFQNGEARIFLGTIAAGGQGITLTRANTVVFLDRSWSPALNMQAEDRLHRVGQKNAVQVIDLMARNTVDLGRHQRLEEKWGWLRKVLGDG